MVMANKSKPKSELMPFGAELGPRLGSGQDNAVFQMVWPAEKPHLREPTGQVLKINHATVGEHKVRLLDDREAAMSGLRYKKNKYDILKRFLGDFVPDSSFVLGQVTEGRNVRYAEYTIQEEVPRVSLSGLSEEQRESPVLREQVKELMNRLKRMYGVLGEVNARTAQGVTLDGKLDLGGVSDHVRAESIDHIFDDQDASAVISENSSPNLLVNPDTLRLYCIDFDQGQWLKGMDEAKALALEIADRQDQEMGTMVGGVALGSVVQEPTLPFAEGI